MGIGDWGLGIGDWGLGPIPNPQSPSFINKIFFNNIYYLLKIKIFIYKYKKYLLFKLFNYSSFKIKYYQNIFDINRYNSIYTIKY